MKFLCIKVKRRSFTLRYVIIMPRFIHSLLTNPEKTFLQRALQRHRIYSSVSETNLKAMKNAIILFLSLLLFSNTSWGQQYHMLGRFVNTAPDSTSLDSVAFEFTATTYAYYVNASTVPSSSGTYAVVTSTMAPDSLFLFEDSLGVCNTNNGGYTVKFGLQ